MDEENTESSSREHHHLNEGIQQHNLAVGFLVTFLVTFFWASLRITNAQVSLPVVTLCPLRTDNLLSSMFYNTLTEIIRFHSKEDVFLLVSIFYSGR